MAEGRFDLKELLSRWKYVLVVAAVGLGLLLWPSDDLTAGEPASEQVEEARLEALLNSMEGVGQVEVLLSEKGAAVVCQGADSGSVRLAVTETVRCYTGLGADKIAIYKMTEHSEG